MADDVPERLRAALAGRYTIERELGRGGMALVFLARDLRHDRPVAIKVLRAELSAALGSERFLREIRLAAKLQHPHILPLFDSGEAGGSLYYVMPRVEGESLRERLEREGQLALDEALHIASEVCDALSYAHSHGIVHRDIKPENILLAGGHALVADFGIALAITAAGGDKLTDTGIAVGTPPYMSPEQAGAGPRIDGRSDLYSLGCVLYEMLAGVPPFTGPSGQAVLARHSVDPVPPLRTLRKAVPEHVERAIMRALEKTPADRYATTGQFADALVQVKAGAAARLRWKGMRAAQRRSVATTVVVMIVLIATVAWLWVRQSRAGWARSVALPEAERLMDQGKVYAAYRMLRQAEAYLPDDPIVKELLVEWTTPVSVHTAPPGAQVYVRDFFDSPDTWERLGSAPLDGVRLPLGNLVWRISLAGFQTQEVLGFTPDRTLQFSLPLAAEAPPGMVPVRGGRTFGLYSTEPVELDDYWIDKYEVTNRMFKEFIGRGGYEQRESWTEPFFRDGRAVTSQEARQVFRDRTGRPGPASWELGTYPDGQADYPVGGVSWYEAAAYCASVGLGLPTVHHWYRAADLGSVTEVAQYGNFASAGPMAIGQALRIGVNGTYDMAGNVKEWVWNAAGSNRRYILGGGWNEASYQFSDPDAQRPFDRQPTYGFRCARYRAPLAAALTSSVQAPSRDYRRETPVGNEVFAIYKSMYQYDRTALEARIDSVADQSEHWRVEWVSFAAAYGNERVAALLYLPKSTRPPYQTVVYFPGGNAFRQQSAAAALEVEGDWFLFVVRSGRAVLFPLYKGTYERHVVGVFELPHVWRDVIIDASKDFGRAVDYLETRPDIDADKLAYLGLSMGAGVGPIMTAVEPRVKASVLLGGGLYSWRRPPESEAINFLPRVKVPTLMINGRHDFFFPLETSQAPLFHRLGTPTAHKRHRVFDTGHVPTERQEVIRDILDWLDQYLGPVTSR